MNDAPGNRRPVKSRGAGWTKACAATLARWGVSPDAISAASAAFAIWGLAAFLWSGQSVGVARILALAGAAAAIQLRLLCNLLDGMVAVEHQRGGPAGPIWNELPDRISDILLLVGAGYAAAATGPAWASAVGWIAALMAVLTAYVRELGRGLGQAADFSGPGAKPHRMALLTVTALLAAVVEPRWAPPGTVLTGGLTLIAGLAAITVIRRTHHLATRLGA